MTTIPDLLKPIGLRFGPGYRVKTASWCGLAQIVTRPAVVVTDPGVPGIDGNAAVEQINAQHPTLPVIILTAHGTIPDAVATQRGPSAFHPIHSTRRSCSRKWRRQSPPLVNRAKPMPAAMTARRDRDPQRQMDDKGI